MNTTSSQQKPWFACAIDLFAKLHNEDSITCSDFVTETIHLAKQIQRLAIRKFDEDEETIPKLAERIFQELSKLPCHQKINVLVNSQLFKLIVSKREPPKELSDHEYYRDSIVLKQLQGYSKMKQIDLSFIQKDLTIVNWICEANETTQTAEERHEMAVSMKEIPTDYYEQTQQQRMKIGQLITSKETCREVIQLLSNPTKEEMVELLTNSTIADLITIYEKYRQLILGVPDERSQNALKRNLIVSLQIRSRQLP